MRQPAPTWPTPSLDQSVALRSSAVRLGEDFVGNYGPETIERCRLPAKPVITKKPQLDIPGIFAMGEGHPVALDNSVQNRLGF